MKQLTDKEVRVVNAMAENFFKIVPLDYRTYCALTSRISKNTLRHFGIAAELLPCQVWFATPERNYIVGFIGNSASSRKWDGHVVCSAGNFIIDAALHQFNAEFGLPAPTIVVTPKFLVPTQVVSRLNLDENNRLWWHLPPALLASDLVVPDEPPELIAKYAGQLIDCLSASGAVA